MSGTSKSFDTRENVIFEIVVDGAGKKKKDGRTWIWHEWLFHATSGDFVKKKVPSYFRDDTKRIWFIYFWCEWNCLWVEEGERRKTEKEGKEEVKKKEI